MDSTCIRVYIFFFLISLSKSQRSRLEIKLHQDLLENYNTDIRPSNGSEGFEVDVKLLYTLFAIREFDEKTGKLSISGAMIFFWTDKDLAWNISEYGGTTRISMKRSKIWTPTLVLTNPFNRVQHLGSDGGDGFVNISHNGNILWTPSSFLDAHCLANITYFPFDTQRCDLVFIPSYYLEKELPFVVLQDPFNLESYISNGIWDLVDHRLYTTSDHYQKVHMKIVIKRKALFYIMNIILPVHCIGLLNVFVFLLPIDSGERTGFSVTILLAMAVFLTMVSDSLPETSSPSLSILSSLLFVEFTMSCLITVTVILIIRCHHKGKDKHIPLWLQVLVCLLNSGSCCDNKGIATENSDQQERSNNISTINTQNDVDELQEVAFPNRNISSFNTHRNYRLRQELSKIDNGSCEHAAERRHSDVEHRNSAQHDDKTVSYSTLHVTWKDVVDSLDTLFFAVFVFCFCCISITFLIVYMPIAF